MKILIIEDESRAANQLKNLLNELNQNYELLDVLDSVEDSIIWLNENEKPELIFMDIQLADGLSFEIFQHVQVRAPIIFTTAFDQYAIQAFKVNSIDYLLKPIQKDDLEMALNKFKSTSQSKALGPDLIKELFADMQKSKKREGILVKDGSGFIHIAIKDLLYFYSEQSITFGVTSSKRYIIEETMNELMDSLDSDQFFRINRGQIISKNAVQKIEPYFNHRVKLLMEQSKDQEFVVSRPKTSEFKEWMNA